MEDCRVHYDRSVRTSDGGIVQLLYGEDAMDARWVRSLQPGRALDVLVI
jgi:hypothetical protein